jgi:hypothetical protein
MYLHHRKYGREHSVSWRDFLRRSRAPRYQFEMIGIATFPNATDMVYLHPIGDRAFEQPIRDAMGAVILSRSWTKPNPAVAALISGSYPYPTACIRREPPLLVKANG